MNTTSTTRNISWFGKLPCVGDFCSQNMSAYLLGTLDAWLSKALQEGQETHGNAWTQAYFETPMHGFLWGKNTLHTLPGDVVAGVMMPSVDKAGREFPFILMEQISAHPKLPLCTQSLNNWFLHAHCLCADALNEEWSLDRLNHALADLPTLQWAHHNTNATTAKPGHSQWFRIEFSGHIHKMLECAGLPQAHAFETLLGLEQQRQS